MNAVPHIPFEVLVGPNLPSVRAAHQAWLQRYRLVESGHAITSDLCELAAYVYPLARGSDLKLGFDFIGWLYIFDDIVDESDSDPETLAGLVRSLCAALHQHSRGVSEDAEPLVASFHDLWQRSRQGMPAAWRVRAEHHWEQYFCSQPQEAAGARLRMITSENYLAIRHDASASECALDLAERLQGFKTPELSHHSMPFRAMRELTIDVLNLCNDLHSLGRESTQEEPSNMASLLIRHQGMSEVEAINQVADQIRRKVAEFCRLMAEADDTCTRLGLTDQERINTHKYIDALKAWMSGYEHWGSKSKRYVASPVTLQV